MNGDDGVGDELWRQRHRRWRRGWHGDGGGLEDDGWRYRWRAGSGGEGVGDGCGGVSDGSEGS